MCIHEIQSPVEGIYFCKHPRVIIQDNLVCDRICNGCRFKDVPIEPGTGCASCGRNEPVFDEYLTGKAREAAKKFRLTPKEEKQPKVIDAPRETPKLPPLWVQAKNFARASAEHILAGLPVVSDDQHKERLQACAACPKLLRAVGESHVIPEVTESDRCTVCGCFVEEKSVWGEQSCPDSPARWGPALPS